MTISKIADSSQNIETSFKLQATVRIKMLSWGGPPCHSGILGTVILFVAAHMNHIQTASEVGSANINLLKPWYMGPTPTDPCEYYPALRIKNETEESLLWIVTSEPNMTDFAMVRAFSHNHTIIARTIYINSCALASTSMFCL